MNKTQENIYINAIKLFNKNGVSNVRLQDIAKKAGISAGNLSYHVKLKKDLIAGVLEYMKHSFKEMNIRNMTHFEQNDYAVLVKNYMGFQISHRFFYRDILEISRFVPEAKTLYEKQMNQIINFTKNGMYLAVGKGLVKPEPHEMAYHFYAKNAWATLNSWLIEREILGDEKVSMHEVILANWEILFPCLTEKGQTLFLELKKQLPMLIKEGIGR